MRIKNKVTYKLNIKTLLFLFLEFLGAIVFSAISVLMYKYGDAIFSGFLLPLIIKIFCLYMTIDLWETLYKNIKPKFNKEEDNIEYDIIEPENLLDEGDDDDITPRAPKFDE